MLLKALKCKGRLFIACRANSGLGLHVLIEVMGHRWVSADWLKQWADQGSTEPVKNDPLLCSHGKLDPAKKTGVS